MTPYRRMSADFETRSTCDLPKAGAHRYARDATTDVLVVSYAFDDEPPRRWIRGEPVPQDVVDYVAGDGPIWAFNSEFERQIWTHVLGPRYGWPVPPLERFYCTASMAAAMALPRRLGDVVSALGLEEAKDDTGRRIMMQLSRPRSKPGQPLRWWEPEDVPAKFERLYSYCDNDVVIERAASAKLRPLSEQEREIWLENCRVNERGLPIDVVSVKRAIKVVENIQAALDREMGIVTRNAVTKTSQVANLTRWLAEQGIVVESIDKASMRDLLARDDLTREVRRALEIRQEAAKSSTAKLKAFLACVCEDGRARGCIRYHGATTGRDAGELVQPQNFLRPKLDMGEIDGVIEALSAQDPAWLDIWAQPGNLKKPQSALDVIASCMRAMICAPAGAKIYAGDLSNIEGREAAWLADEQWKLEAFRAYDEGRGPDLYKVAASEMLGISIDDIDDDLRQIGKTSELALQFQGAHGAFITMGANYGVTPATVAPVIKAAVSCSAWAEACERYDPKNRYDLPLDEWVALRITVDAWRARHPKIVEQWGLCEQAAFDAVRNPGRPFKAGKLSYASAGGILFCRLPNGRLLHFIDAKIREVETPWGKNRLSVTYMSLNSATKKYERTKGYAGLFFQNSVQGVARDVIMDAKLRFKARGWPTILKVHDELVTEITGDVPLDEFVRELSIVPDWNHGCPIAAKAVAGRRYGK